MKIIKVPFLTIFLSLSIGYISNNNPIQEFHFMKNIQSVEDIKKIFPTTTNELKSLSQKTLQEVQKGIAEIIAIPADQRNLGTILRAFDHVIGNFKKGLQIIELLTYVSPHDELRAIAEQESVSLQQTSVECIQFNEKLYQVFKDYAANIAPQEKLSAQEQYLLNEILKDFQRDGLDLPSQKREQLIALQKEVAELSLVFEKNIASDLSTIKVTRDQLVGLNDNFIEALEKTDDGLYILGIDYPTYFTVRENCHVSNTRKALNKIFLNRGYPANKPILEKLVEIRKKIAIILGYQSFSDFIIENEMAKNPQNVRQFLNEVLQKVRKKEASEFELFKNNLPNGVTLTADQTFYPWDTHYIIAQYKINYFNIDETKIAEYFPMDHTIEQLLKIYEQFLAIELKEEKISGLWHEDIRLIAVHKDTKLIGYLLLDLYPRPNKFSHACQITVIPALKSQEVNPALAVVIANFPKATKDKPALLKRSDVTVFFHEFGHALHAVLGTTEVELLSGTNVKTDFVEMPSQMLEEWLNNKEILKQVSAHYLTGQPLPDATIDTLLKLKNLSSGTDLLRQIWISFISLETFNEVTIDPDDLNRKLSKALKPHEFYDEDVHFYAGFGHLPGYNAKYYSYLWSKVFALDLFDTINKTGLLNPEIGVRYRDTILAAGGSKDPNELLEDFLGRKPNADAFIRDLGL